MPFINFKYGIQMKYEIKSSNEVDTWNYVEIFLHSGPQKNHESIGQNLELFVPFFKKHVNGIDYSLLANNSTEGVVGSGKQTDIENMESIAKTLSAAQVKTSGWRCNTLETTNTVKKSTQ